MGRYDGIKKIVLGERTKLHGGHASGQSRAMRLIFVMVEGGKMDF